MNAKPGFLRLEQIHFVHGICHPPICGWSYPNRVGKWWRIRTVWENCDFSIPSSMGRGRCNFFQPIFRPRLLLPTVLMVICSNLLAFRIAQKRFKARIPDLEEGETARMSLTYMKGTLGVLLIFQKLGFWLHLTTFLETSPPGPKSLLFLMLRFTIWRTCSACPSYPSYASVVLHSPPKKRPIGTNWNWRHFHQYHLEFQPYFFRRGPLTCFFFSLCMQGALLPESFC